MTSPVLNTYRPPRWLPGGHLQTLYSVLLAPRPRIDYRRERWEAPDGDFVDLDWVDAPTTAPLVVWFHGLEGSSKSHYAQTMMALLQSHRWRGVVVNFRGCSGELNRRPRAYHSGDSDELDWILRRLHKLAPGAPLFAAGVSLGGNALLKWLGEEREGSVDLVRAAASICAPIDLRVAGDHLGLGVNRIYTRHFLRTLKAKALQMLVRFPSLANREAVAKARTLRAFDDCFTAPVHGFRDTDHYWSASSSKPWLKSIRIPTLIINALNDPFVPSGSLPTAAEVSDAVALEYPDFGGHVGFVSGVYPGRLNWLPARIYAYFAGVIGAEQT
jgi:uncharacterized protein